LTIEFNLGKERILGAVERSTKDEGRRARDEFNPGSNGIGTDSGNFALGLLRFSSESDKSSVRTVEFSTVNRVGDGSGTDSEGGLTVETSTIELTIQTIVESDNAGGELVSAPTVTQARRLAKLGGSVTDDLVVSIWTVAVTSSGARTRSGFTTISIDSTNSSSISSTIDTKTGGLTVSTRGQLAVRVDYARNTDTGSSVTHLLVRGATTIGSTAISAIDTANTSPVLVTVGASRGVARAGAYFSKVYGTGVDTHVCINVANSLLYGNSTIRKATLSISVARDAMTILVTIG